MCSNCGKEKAMEKKQIQGGKNEDGKGFKNAHKPTRAQVTGQVKWVKAPEPERRVNRSLAGEDRGTEEKSCPQVLLPFPPPTWATRRRQNHTGFSPTSTTHWLIDPEQVADRTLVPRFTVRSKQRSRRLSTETCSKTGPLGSSP